MKARFGTGAQTPRVQLTETGLGPVSLTQGELPQVIALRGYAPAVKWMGVSIAPAVLGLALPLDIPFDRGEVGHIHPKNE